MNNPELTVFPAMLKHYNAPLKYYSKKMAPADNILQSCKSAWQELDSASIDQGFILMHRITAKFVAHKGKKNSYRTMISTMEFATPLLIFWMELSLKLIYYIA